ncbi:MAG: putative toxin-antitoxin system toxin component, PIN family [Gammaproteobacteria bacterium]
MSRLRAVIDTNVWVSAYYTPGGVSARVIQCWRERQMVLCLSLPIMAEYRAKFARKFARAEKLPKHINDDIVAMMRGGLFYPFPPLLPDCVPGDVDDEKFLECAVVAKAGYVVSGDRHLLAQTGYRGIAIVSPGVFVRDFL